MDPRLRRSLKRKDKGGGPTVGQVVTFLMFMAFSLWAIFWPRGG